MRLAIFTDYTYRRDAEGLSGDRAFVRYMTALRPHTERLVLIGRENPESGRSHYAIPADVEVLGLPWYDSLSQPAAVLRSLGAGSTRFWRLLDDIDTVWLLGPYLHAVWFAVLARMRGRRVVLGVRQDLPTYVRSRRPETRWMHAAADGLEATFRAMGRRMPVAVVGPALARTYGASPHLIELAVSLVSVDDLIPPGEALARPRGEPAQIVSVGRLDTEKNPLLLADVLAGLRADGVEVRLVVVGDGPLRAELEARLAELGVAHLADVKGYVPLGGGLAELYRGSDLFLHVSHTEGLPQVLFEAFAAGVPVVATDVGGVAAAAGAAAVLIPPRDAPAAVRAVARMLSDPVEREQRVRAGHDIAAAHTLEHEVARLAAFLRAG